MLFKAIQSLRPNTEFTIIDNDIKSIIWHTEGVTTPTKKQIDDEIKRLELAELTAIQVQENARASALAKLEALGLSVDEVKAIIG